MIDVAGLGVDVAVAVVAAQRLAAADEPLRRRLRRRRRGDGQAVVDVDVELELVHHDDFVVDGIDADGREPGVRVANGMERHPRCHVRVADRLRLSGAACLPFGLAHPSTSLGVKRRAFRRGDVPGTRIQQLRQRLRGNQARRVKIDSPDGLSLDGIGGGRGDQRDGTQNPANSGAMHGRTFRF